MSLEGRVEALEAAVADMDAEPLGPQAVRALLREAVTVVGPGEVLILRCPENWSPAQCGALQDTAEYWLALNAPAVQVLVVPYVDMAVAECPA